VISCLSVADSYGCPPAFSIGLLRDPRLSFFRCLWFFLTWSLPSCVGSPVTRGPTLVSLPHSCCGPPNLGPRPSLFFFKKGPDRLLPSASFSGFFFFPCQFLESPNYFSTSFTSSFSPFCCGFVREDAYRTFSGPAPSALARVAPSLAPRRASRWPLNERPLPYIVCFSPLQYHSFLHAFVHRIARVASTPRVVEFIFLSRWTFPARPFYLVQPLGSPPAPPYDL